jgi:hypothetical protein
MSLCIDDDEHFGQIATVVARTAKLNRHRSRNKYFVGNIKVC